MVFATELLDQPLARALLLGCFGWKLGFAEQRIGINPMQGGSRRGRDRDVSLRPEEKRFADNE